MLLHLKIKNYILIKDLDIDFEEGFSVITGETGAGKSILLGALGLILGERAESKQLFNDKEKCVIEGTFNIEPYNLNPFFEDKNLDYDNQTILRREVAENGKSRAFVNDTPVSLSDLKELGTRLVDIHSQHETLQLNSAKYQIGFIDAYCANKNLLQQYDTHYRQYRILQMELQSLLEQESQMKKDLDYFQFQWNELHEAQLNETEYDSIVQEIDSLNNADEIKNSAIAASNILIEQELNILDQLNEIRQLLAGVAKFHTPVAGLHERIQSASIELKDIARDLRHIAESTFADGEKIAIYNQKLQTVFNLQKKHQVQSITDLLKIYNELEERINSITGFDEKIESLKQSIATLQSQLHHISKELSERRVMAMPKIITALQSLLLQVGLVNALVQFDHTATENAFNDTGIDKIQLLFTGNKGSALAPIHKAASGGELSRLMLCIKYLMAQTTLLPTLIFDEIDSGISGEVSMKVGAMMQQMSQKHQVFAITHLPQIASKGTHHYFVYKQLQNNVTVSHIKKLNNTERQVEIAKMLGGEKPSETALANAKELLGI
ncbi:MAG: DNA repair protein RecN [Bacteroidetes bacterium]|nr:DNA repair protein RecN [Bacteroidota bacterium]